MEINIPTGQDISIQYVNKAFVYITDCNPPLKIESVNSLHCPMAVRLYTYELNTDVQQ